MLGTMSESRERAGSFVIVIS